jgi:hypothetical protein
MFTRRHATLPLARRQGASPFACVFRQVRWVEAGTALLRAAGTLTFQANFADGVISGQWV